MQCSFLFPPSKTIAIAMTLCIPPVSYCLSHQAPCLDNMHDFLRFDQGDFQFVSKRIDRRLGWWKSDIFDWSIQRAYRCKITNSEVQCLNQVKMFPCRVTDALKVIYRKTKILGSSRSLEFASTLLAEQEAITTTAPCPCEGGFRQTNS